MKMAHVTIMTAKLDESIVFYEQAVGLKILGDMRNTPHPIVFMADQEGDTQVELVANPLEPYNGSGLLIGFNVDDIDAEYQAKKDMGLNPSEMVMPNPHAKFFMVQDPNGVTIQFVHED